MDKVTDQVEPGEKWAFDANVTQAFDDMLARSIPQYLVMRQACYDLAKAHMKPKTYIVDLGCSRGEALSQLIDHFGAHAKYLGVEISDPMLEAARQRYKGLIDCGVVDIRKLDLRTDYPPVPASVTLCVLTLQFTPIEYRLKIMRNIYQNLVPGGALIMVEKILGGSADLDDIFVNLYYDFKRSNHYTEEQIQRKRLSLEGVLVPMTAHWNEEMLRITGFTQIDCFWRWFNFAGWIAVK